MPWLKLPSPGRVSMIGSIALLMIGCAPREELPVIVGKWMLDEEESRQVLEFREDGTATWTLDSESQRGELNILYRFEPSHDPHHLDLRGFQEGPLVGYVLYGIVEFDETASSFRFDCNRGSPISSAHIRPRAFTVQTVEYERVLPPPEVDSPPG